MCEIVLFPLCPARLPTLPHADRASPAGPGRVSAAGMPQPPEDIRRRQLVAQGVPVRDLDWSATLFRD